MGRPEPRPDGDALLAKFARSADSIYAELKKQRQQLSSSSSAASPDGAAPTNVNELRRVDPTKEKAEEKSMRAAAAAIARHSVAPSLGHARRVINCYVARTPTIHCGTENLSRVFGNNCMLTKCVALCISQHTSN